MHHIISLSSLEPDTTYDPNVQENLVTLCHSCHQGFHKGYEDDYTNEIIRWIDEVPLDEVRSKLAQYNKEKAERKEFNRLKHIAKKNE